LEEALNQSEERFRSLIEHSYGAVVLIDANGTFTYVGPSIRRVLGYETHELLGTNGFNLVHPDDLNEAQVKFAGVLQGPKNTDGMEVRVRHKDAGWRWFEVTGTNLLDEPAVQGVVVNFRDIGERKQWEAALQQKAERLHQARQAGRICIWELDLLASRLAWEGFESIHGWETGTAPESPEALMDSVYPEERESVVNAVTRAIEQDTELDLEHRITWPDGSVRWIQCKGQVYKDQEGRAVRMVGTCHDINQQKTAEMKSLRP
jgi:PAS domain S-box-containing protein